MSDVPPPKAWTWEISNVDNMPPSQLKVLFRNRTGKIANGDIKQLLKDLEIDDKKMKSFNEMTIKQLKSELRLRKLSSKDATRNQLISRLSLNQIPSIQQQLVIGYIREKEIVLEGGLFIPRYLKDLILSFCESTVFAFYFTQKSPNNLRVACMNNNNNRYELKIIQMNPDKTSHSDWNGELFHSTKSKSIVLPPKINGVVSKYKKYSTDRWDMIFTGHDEISVLMVNETELSNNKQDGAFAFNWNLPSRGSNLDYSPYFIYFDEEYGLLAGEEDSFKSLSFTSDQYLQQNNEWKWKTLKAPGSGRYEESCVMIEKDGKKQLFVIANGGRNNRMYDFETDLWKMDKVGVGSKVHETGICYDNNTQSIYLGGVDPKYPNPVMNYGNYLVQSYDLIMQYWMKLPSTVMEHGNHPIMWVDKINPKILFIGSDSWNGLEYIDLRETDKGWKCVRIPNHNDSLSAMFGLGSFWGGDYSRLSITNS